MIMMKNNILNLLINLLIIKGLKESFSLQLKLILISEQFNAFIYMNFLFILGKFFKKLSK